jgi:endo-1,4-beta-D-glucanase Y
MSRFPFPQRFTSSRYFVPANADSSQIQIAYQQWKQTLLTRDGAGGHLRVRRPNSKGAVVNSTVSEGIAYGMLIAVYMDDQETFDELWKYSQRHLNARGLMQWYIDATGDVLGDGGATDADEDIAFALVMADRQWGGRGSLDRAYIDCARRQIELIWEHEVAHGSAHILKPGDVWGGPDVTNPSYFAPAFYRTFAKVSGNREWLGVVDSSYAIIEVALDRTPSPGKGLVPAWCTADGIPTHNPRHFQFDSCRTPFRIAQDWCWHGEPRARTYLEKITSFYESIGLESIVDGFDLDGTPHPEFSQDGARAAAFVGPAGAAAMHDEASRGLAEGAWSALVTRGALILGEPGSDNGGSIYYNTSWRVLSLLMLNGTFFDLTLFD